MAGKANQADFAATVPWNGIIGKPATFPSSPSSMVANGASDGSLLAWDSAFQQWKPITLLQLKQRLDAL